MPAGQLTLLRLLSRSGQVHAILTYMTSEAILNELHRTSGDFLQYIHLNGTNDSDEPVDCWYERDVICGFLIERYDKARATSERMMAQHGRIHH